MRTLRGRLWTSALAPRLIEGVGIVWLETDGLTVKTQLFIRVVGIKPTLEPLLRRQLFFRYRRSHRSRAFLFLSGQNGGA